MTKWRKYNELLQNIIRRARVYTAIDQALEAYCGISPEILYMPRIRLDAPREWCMANPGELSLTEKGAKDPDEIIQNTDEQLRK